MPTATSARSTTGKVLRRTAFVMMAAFGLLGGLFVAGETLDDPGGWAAVGMIALWLVPLVALCVLALRRSAAAGPLFVALTAAAVLFTLADGAFEIIPRDDWGPVTAVAVWALGVALAFLGLRRATLAGILLLLLGLGQMASALMATALRDGVDGPGPRAALGGSSGVVVLPILVVGALFLVAGLVDRDGAAPAKGATPRQRDGTNA